MKKIVFAVAALSLCSLPALAGDAAGKPPAAKAPAAAPAPAAPTAAPAAPGMDMSKMGPWTRKPTNEKAAKKEIEALFKSQEEMEKKGDMEGMLAAVDFPVYMVTDDSKGAAEASSTSKEQYIAMMKPFHDNMPKDMKTKHKFGITVLSDNLAMVTDDFSMTHGKMKMAGRNGGLLVKKDGKWMWKMMVEAGWGGMGEGREMKGEMMKKEPTPEKKAASAAPAPMKK